MSIGIVKATRKPLYCSFCGKERDDVGYLVAGPCVFICNECIELCREIGENHLQPDGEFMSGDEFRAKLLRGDQ